MLLFLYAPEYLDQTPFSLCYTDRAKAIEIGRDLHCTVSDTNRSDEQILNDHFREFDLASMSGCQLDLMEKELRLQDLGPARRYIYQRLLNLAPRESDQVVLVLGTESEVWSLEKLVAFLRERANGPETFFSTQIAAPLDDLTAVVEAISVGDVRIVYRKIGGQDESASVAVAPSSIEVGLSTLKAKHEVRVLSVEDAKARMEQDPSSPESIGIQTALREAECLE